MYVCVCYFSLHQNIDCVPTILSSFQNIPIHNIYSLLVGLVGNKVMYYLPLPYWKIKLILYREFEPYKLKGKFLFRTMGMPVYNVCSIYWRRFGKWLFLMMKVLFIPTNVFSSLIFALLLFHIFLETCHTSKVFGRIKNKLWWKK